MTYQWNDGPLTYSKDFLLQFGKEVTEGESTRYPGGNFRYSSDISDTNEQEALELAGALKDLLESRGWTVTMIRQVGQAHRNLEQAPE